ncbi:tetratricopeptide repeat protein [Sphingomonas carotinifaciens]|uniref:Tetratricopeptide repeat protein n=2 Tax=Sphingomonas carotinifaciens TaxID=1166323 RepID=A0A6N8LV32_9SPHN|nr:tetratricopeptide repeat protein [Sphingomonas carotinifaciens]MWC44274.1 tetratricopeptide repeat protein [Sphingomonas carotinifaciens]
MALTPQSQEAFMREVDDELRRDQMTSFWTRWGLWVIGAIVIGLALFGAYLFWQHRQREAAGAEGEQLQAAYDALAAADVKGASVKLAPLATSDRDGYRVLAQFTQADILLQKDNLKGAAAKFAAVAADTSLAQPFRDLALIRQTAAEYDTLKPQVVVERLRAVAVPGNPYFGSAGEMVAVAQLRMNRRDQAGRLFGQIAQDKDVPDTLRQRAVQMAGVLGVDAVTRNEDTKTQ